MVLIWFHKLYFSTTLMNYILEMDFNLFLVLDFSHYPFLVLDFSHYHFSFPRYCLSFAAESIFLIFTKLKRYI